MKKFFQCRARFITRSALFILMIQPGSNLYCQEILSDDNLIDKAFDAYHSSQYTDAAIYLYAYIQKNPVPIATNSTYAGEVKRAFNYAFDVVENQLEPQLRVKNFNTGLINYEVLRSAGNTAIRNSEWANASIYMYAYIQVIGAAGFAIDPSLNQTYSDCRQNLQQVMSNYNNSLRLQSSNDEEASVTNGLETPPPPFSKPLIMSTVSPFLNVNRSFEGFTDAFRGIFNEVENDFQSFKGEILTNLGWGTTYHTNINIADPLVVPESVIFKDNNWGFRFTVRGSTVNEADRFEGIAQDIERSFALAGINFVKTPLEYKNGDVPLVSVGYKSADRSIVCYRAVFGGSFFDEVIIYHENKQ